MRDRAYDFVYYEIGTGLDFVGDLFRGPLGYSQSLHRQAEKVQTRSHEAKPLSKREQAAFTEILKRRPSEGQVDYWKRKKALLKHPDKHSIIAQHQSRAQDQAPQPTIKVEAASSPRPARSTAPTQAKARTRR